MATKIHRDDVSEARQALDNGLNLPLEAISIESMDHHKDGSTDPIQVASSELNPV